MSALITLDYYLWRYFMPHITMNFFNNKFISLLAIIYISIYRLPRKFLLNYLSRSGRSLTVDTKKLIVGNPIALGKLMEDMASTRCKGLTDGRINICQTSHYNPDYKYSIGSFTIYYSFCGESIDITIKSKYHFGYNNGRITNYLHNWLNSTKEKGHAHDFQINGNRWTINYSDIISTEIKNKYLKHISFNVLV